MIFKELTCKPDHTITRRELLSKYWNRLDAADLDREVHILLEAGVIETHEVGRDTIYKLKFVREES